MRKLSNVQRVVRGALGAATTPTAIATFSSSPGRTVSVTPNLDPGGNTPAWVTRRFPDYTPGGGGGWKVRTNAPSSSPPGELTRHPQQSRDIIERSPQELPRDIIVRSPQQPYAVTVPGPTYPPIPPCGPSPCCRQYDWQWWNTAKI